jgi:hypothetical protein
MSIEPRAAVLALQRSAMFVHRRATPRRAPEEQGPNDAKDQITPTG